GRSQKSAAWSPKPISGFGLSSLSPVRNVPLLAGADAKRAGRDVLTDRRAAADVGTAPHGDRGHQLRVAPDEGAVFNHGPVLFLAVVIAGDGAGADVHIFADGGVAEIRQ